MLLKFPFSIATAPARGCTPSSVVVRHFDLEKVAACSASVADFVSVTTQESRRGGEEGERGGVIASLLTRLTLCHSKLMPMELTQLGLEIFRKKRRAAKAGARGQQQGYKVAAPREG